MGRLWHTGAGHFGCAGAVVRAKDSGQTNASIRRSGVACECRHLQRGRPRGQGPIARAVFRARVLCPSRPHLLAGNRPAHGDVGQHPRRAIGELTRRLSRAIRSGRPLAQVQSLSRLLVKLRISLGVGQRTECRPRERAASMAITRSSGSATAPPAARMSSGIGRWCSSTWWT